MVKFFVPGIPRPAGSKNTFKHSRTGNIVVTDSSGKPGREWRAVVKDFAMQQNPGKPLSGPLYLKAWFYFPRPKAHYGTGRNASNLKPSAPSEHTTKPDTTKLLRAVEDCLAGILFKDDCQITRQYAEKIYCIPELSMVPGCRIQLEQLSLEKGHRDDV